MIYGSTPSKGEDGLYHVKAMTDGGKRCYVHVKNVVVTDDTDAELTFDLSGAVGVENVEAIHANNIDAANENSVAWFTKQLPKRRFPNFTSSRTRFLPIRFPPPRYSVRTGSVSRKFQILSVPSVLSCSSMRGFGSRRRCLDHNGIWFRSSCCQNQNLNQNQPQSQSQSQLQSQNPKSKHTQMTS